MTTWILAFAWMGVVVLVAFATIWSITRPEGRDDDDNHWEEDPND